MKPMKTTLALLLTVFSATTYPGSIYRCDDSAGGMTFRDQACDQEPVDPGTSQSPATQAESPVVSDDAIAHSDRQRQQRRRQAKREAPAEALRVRLLLESSDDIQETGYAENRARCQNALQIAELCGKDAGLFSCDAKGFRHSSIAPKGAEIDNGARFKIEQCALQARKGRS